MDKDLILDILKVSVTPALGCTEPGAVAYAVARAYELLHEEVEILNIYVDKNILKNGMFVSIPGTKEKGIMFASALALVCGKSDYKLQVLKDVTDKDIEKAKEILDKKIIKLSLEKDIEGLYIKVFAKSKNHEAEVIIKNNHDNIVYERKDEQIIKSNDNMKTIDEGSLKNRIKEFNIDELIDFADTVEFDKIKFIDDGIKMNKKIAYAGYNEEVGIGIGKMLKSQVKDVESLAKALTASASEARMSGYPLPVMSSAGSGNHGLVAILPIAIIGQENGFNDEKIIRAVTLSHLLTGYVKAYIGVLSPICGCGVAAGVGASAGLTYIYGGSKEQIKAAVKNVLAGISGMICDGAKIGCAYKLSISVTSALEASKLALNNMFIPSDNGILGITAEKTIQNLGVISNEGMKNTDDVILDIMLKKQ
ncbi:MAG: serine dehydratase subunit alpha family protein [Thermoanaerobacteraceae bacterium]